MLAKKKDPHSEEQGSLITPIEPNTRPYLSSLKSIRQSKSYEKPTSLFGNFFETLLLLHHIPIPNHNPLDDTPMMKKLPF